MTSRPMPSEDLSAGLACPSCHTRLEARAAALHCPGCGVLAPTGRGFPDFVGEPDLDWGELDSRQMEEVVAEARRSAWYAPLLRIGEADPFLAYYILDRSRAGWVWHCLRPANNDVCIDLGSGWGNIAFTLADWYDRVWSVETVRTRVEFQAIRRQQEGKNNLHVVRSGLLSLPFPSDHADLVVCNGVLEWIGLTDLNQPVGALQSRFLLEAFRIVKPGGCLYVGIENRYSAFSFLGARDHSGLPFTNLLPRRLADGVVRRFRAREGRLDTALRSLTVWPDYRTHTHSLTGYDRLFRQAGFSHVDACWVWPSYNAPHYSGRFGDASLKFLGSRLITKSRNRRAAAAAFALRTLPSRLRRLVAQAFWPSFLLFAYKGRPGERLADRMRTPDHSGLVIATTTRISGPKHAYLLLQDGKVARVVSVAGSDASMHDAGASGIPVESSQFGNFRVTVEPGVDGTPLDPHDAAHATRAMEWLLAFQRKAARGPLDGRTWQGEVDRLVEFLRQQERGDEILPYAMVIFGAVDTVVRQGLLQVTAEHGDFQWRNVLLSADGSVHVIDWDDSRPAGNPLLDPGTFLLTLARGNREALAEGVRGRGPLAPAMRGALRTYAAGREVPTLDADTLIGYALIRLLRRDALVLKANGRIASRAFPGAGRLVVDSLSLLPRLAPAGERS